MSKTSKTSQESKPPAWASPLYKQSAKETQSLYNSGAGGNTFMGSTVADMSPTTMQGVNEMAQAGQAWDTSGTRPLYAGLGSAATSNPFMSAMAGLAGGDALQGYASGDYLKGEGNPFYRQRLEREIGDSNALINSNFSGAGRYGSPGAHQQTIADNTSNMLYRGLEDDFNRQTANQFNALGMQGNLLQGAGGMYSTGIGHGLQATDAMSGLDQRNFGNRLTGAGATLQAGGILDEQAQKQLQDEVNKWYALDNQDWSRLGMLQGAAAGSAGSYGTQSSTTRQPADIGKIAGSVLGGLALFSDRRLKTDIHKIGEAKNGLPIYSYKYKAGGPTQLGFMADKVEKLHPEAVAEHASGYKMVNYDKAVKH